MRYKDIKPIYGERCPKCGDPTLGRVGIWIKCYSSKYCDFNIKGEDYGILFRDKKKKS